MVQPSRKEPPEKDIKMRKLTNKEKREGRSYPKGYKKMLQPGEAKAGDVFTVEYTKGLKNVGGSGIDDPTYHKEPNTFRVQKRTNFKKRGCYRLYLRHDSCGWGCAVTIDTGLEEWPKEWESVTKVEEQA